MTAGPALPLRPLPLRRRAFGGGRGDGAGRVMRAATWWRRRQCRRNRAEDAGGAAFSVRCTGSSGGDRWPPLGGTKRTCLAMPVCHSERRATGILNAGWHRRPGGRAAPCGAGSIPAWW